MLTSQVLYTFLIALVMVEIVFYLNKEQVHVGVAKLKWNIISRLDNQFEWNSRSAVLHKWASSSVAVAKPSSNANGLERKRSNKSKKILLYSTMFGSPWIATPVQRVQECGNCFAYLDKSMMAEADVVLFHGGGSQDLPTSTKMPLHAKAKGQKWLFLSLESPINTRKIFDHGGYEGMFEWVSTYSRQSEIYAPYGSFRPLANNPPAQLTLGDGRRLKASDRSRMVLWVVSNCNPDHSPRSRYINHLMNYIHVDIYGKCATSSPCRRGGECVTFRRQYKFSLAFENSFCQEYLTEKYWSCIADGLVPVVMGGANYSEIAIPGSYIDADWFESPRDLASYLEHVARNDTLYAEYFKWRDRYEIGLPNTDDRSFFCKVCDATDDPVLSQSRPHVDFTEKFGPSVCYSTEKVRRRFLNFDEMKTDDVHRGLTIMVTLTTAAVCLLLVEIGRFSVRQWRRRTGEAIS